MVKSSSVVIGKIVSATGLMLPRHAMRFPGGFSTALGKGWEKDGCGGHGPWFVFGDISR